MHQHQSQEDAHFENTTNRSNLSFVSIIPPSTIEVPVAEKTKNPILHNINVKKAIILSLSECLGTAIFIFVGCLGCVSGDKSPDKAVSFLVISFTFGLAIMIAIQCFGHISGAHLNPAVTLAAITLGHIPIIQVPIFIISQVTGATAGFALLQAITSNTTNHQAICSPKINEDISLVQGFFAEFLLTLILIMVCCGIWDYKNDAKHDSTPLRFGFTVMALALGGISYTGANMNPARSFGPALINNTWDHHWIYWIAPMTAGVAGAGFYRLVFNVKKSNKV